MTPIHLEKPEKNLNSQCVTLLLMVDDVSMCSMRAHLKQLAELGHCSSLW